ncbi:MAG: AAA family ATPase [Candidatus Omnitrophica bacterium]|nr:AAA family ATPase [Candidatus Omnitrophota bacterium]
MPEMDPEYLKSQMQEEKLPFEPRTLLVGLWLRLWILVVFWCVTIIVGFVAAKIMGTQTFAAETVLLYKPSALGAQIVGKEEQLPIDTLMHMVKVRTNLEEVRRRLGLEVRTSIIGYACDVEVQRDTTLMIIQCYWDNPRIVAALANSLRDVFMENIGKIHISTIDSLYEEALREKQVLKSKQAEIRVAVEVSKQNAEAEQEAESSTEDMQRMLTRMHRIRSAISDDKKHSEDLKRLAELELAYKNAKKLYELGAVAKEAVDKAAVILEKQKKITYDTEKIKNWKSQLEEITEAVAPSNQKKAKMIDGPSDAVEQRALDLQLEEVALDERIKYLEQLREETITGELAGEHGQKDFTVVSIAEVPSTPSHSTTKMLFVGICFVGFTVGIILVVLLVLLDTTLKSAPEVFLKLNHKTIGIVPKISGRQKLTPAEEGSNLLELFKIISRKVRSLIPQRGAKILIVSTKPGEGKTVVSTNLAACLGRQDERVLLVDANVRAQSSQKALGELLFSEQGPLKGLGEYLSYEADSVDEIIWPTALPGVECVPRVGKAVLSDMLGSNRMKEFLDECASRYGVVVIDSPPLQSYVDAELLAQWSDAIILVIQSHYCKGSQIKKILERLKTTKAPIAGVILNRVDKLYLELD